MITEALVKSVTFKDDKLEIQLKDGRKVRPVSFCFLCSSGNPLLVIGDFLLIYIFLPCRSELIILLQRLAWSPTSIWLNQQVWRSTQTLVVIESMQSCRPDPIFGW